MFPEIIEEELYDPDNQRAERGDGFGTNDMISELQNYLGQIDYPTPQILIEALVVDYNTSNIRDIGVMFGSTNSIPDSLGWSNTGQLDLGINNNGLFTTQLNGAYLNDPLDDIGNWLGVGNLGVLPSDFYVKIQALENQGKAISVPDRR